MSKMNFVHPPEFKESTRHRKIEQLPPPKKAILPLSQHTGAPSEPVVNIGDIVKTGSLIARSKGFISANLHSSISGKVVAIEQSPHPVIGSSNAIVIESDGQDLKAFSETGKKVSSVSKEDIISIVKEAGIVGLGGAAFPTSVKLSPSAGKKIDTLIINGAECEPFLTCDYRLMLEKSKEIMLGVFLIAKALGVKDVLIGIEDNKLDAIEALGSALFRLRIAEQKVSMRKLKTRYPQGGEKQLTKTLLNREVPSGGLPLDIGCVVNNVQTVFSVYEAVYMGKPLYERVVTVSGSFLKNPKNLLVRIGTPIKELLETCGLDVKQDIYKIIMGGPMTGVAQYNLDAPVIKGTSGILVLNRASSEPGQEMDCIRCSRCIDACPAGLMPCMIGVAARRNRFDIASTYNPFDCIECGACGYVCPSNIELVQLIKLAKAKLKKS
ncbi:MAG: electron transport complex subunit RsxC [Candidatus Omnitrophica bacterium]|nr:electron transport complex subunit RsxC [Candidatus Omnitrophota bacterium]